MDAISLSLFSSRLDAVCEEMGVALQRAAFSLNIRDRLDYSCAIFDAAGELRAQAAHIPVHLGSMAFAMADIVSSLKWQPGDMVIMNNPYMGGTHLPDVTAIAPVFNDRALVGFVVNRAHHADIGSDTPGSMPLSRSLLEEGVIIPPTFVMRDFSLVTDKFNALIDSLRNHDEARGDFSAQFAANRLGLKRLGELISSAGVDAYLHHLEELDAYAQKLALATYRAIPDGSYHFEDVMDDDGLGSIDIPICVTITVRDGDIDVDFVGTSAQVDGNINCPLPVVAAAVFYCFRCLLPEHTPACAGSFRNIHLHAPEACLVNAGYPAAVAAGNVETSTRIVDVVLGALAKAMGDVIPAASHGSMNNIAMGSSGGNGASCWDYYETIGGGMGAGSRSDGLSAVQTHMTNTLNTSIEALEMTYPVRVKRYQVRNDSGGAGYHKGGDGIVREFEFLQDAEVTLLTERRKNSPWGLQGGEPGKAGINLHNAIPIPAKTFMHVKKGDVVEIRTPGGGGWGSHS